MYIWKKFQKAAPLFRLSVFSSLKHNSPDYSVDRRNRSDCATVSRSIEPRRLEDNRLIAARPQEIHRFNLAVSRRRKGRVCPRALIGRTALVAGAYVCRGADCHYVDEISLGTVYRTASPPAVCSFDLLLATRERLEPRQSRNTITIKPRRSFRPGSVSNFLARIGRTTLLNPPPNFRVGWALRPYLASDLFRLGVLQRGLRTMRGSQFVIYRSWFVVRGVPICTHSLMPRINRTLWVIRSLQLVIRQFVEAIRALSCAGWRSVTNHEKNRPHCELLFAGQ